MSEFRFPQEELVTERLRLRAVGVDDAEDVAAACGAASTREFLPFLPNPYTVADALDWITNQAMRAYDEGGAQWALTDRETGRFLGVIGLPIVHKGRGAAEIGYWTAPWERGRGHMSEALIAVTEWLFKQPFHRATLAIDPANIASQRVALAAGYRREGVQRGEIVLADGSFGDSIVFSRLSTDPAGRTPRALPDLPGGHLTDGVVLVRPIDERDIEATWAAWNTPDIMRATVSTRVPTRDEAAKYTRAAYAEWLAGTAARMAICDAGSGEHVGSIGVYFKSGPGTAMLGIHLDSAARGKGYATRATKLVTEWAFTEAKAERVEAGTATWNAGSQAIMERLGWTREGVMRALIPAADGGRDDVVMWAVVREAAGG
ncbi:hypothetical protein Afil01_10520 [Actinorhabdospora filicis]|uniref:N-acetyltransferase domain-containing protein n=1 Tax=Actinorhabdospora filicis TaxID=1785913 RepID=A0A9W6SHU2_9ACTN|nr:GNAT family N-acetyltransferase [Actinorhabdospora filicis]GLZ76245.1 hypothetical protein Afil01_10520 [Actinorhabdospora filicis]